MYGFGFSALGIKDGLFQLFLFFYFSQILGLSAALAGTATVISLMFDSVSDPLIGFISDKWTSKKWGRRHPFMFLSAIPIGIFTYLLFLPPDGMSEKGLFWWLTVFSILVRFSLTFFLIPAMSLGAELSDDYEERTVVTSYRIMFAALISPLIMTFGLLFYFKPRGDMTNGLFNVEAYPKFALLCGILMAITIFISTWGTRDQIPRISNLNNVSERKISIWKSISVAIRMRSFQSLVGGIMITYIAIGVGTIFIPYYTTYYFGLSERELAVLPIASAVGGIVSWLIAPKMGRVFDKKNASIISALMFGTFFSLPFFLRMTGAFPANGSSLLLPIYVLCNTIGYIFIFVSGSMTNSMMADVVDEYELISGQRDEGLFFSTMSFAYKCTVGLGYFVAGLLLTWIQFPEQTASADVPQQAIDGLGIIGGPVIFILYLSSILFLVFYPISKNRYLEIKAGLDLKI